MNIQNSKFKIEKIPDFWSRRDNAQTHVFEFAPLGMPARITANQAGVLDAARLSAGRFSRAPAADAPPVQVQVVVTRRGAGPLPPNLPDRLAYTGVGDWISVSAGGWGYGFASLSHRQAVAVLSPELAAATRLVSRCIIDHYLLNFLLAGWGMLHASCVLTPGRRLVAMIAPHNTGKSTTALHLLRAGFTFLADGMLLFRPADRGFQAAGYPIGEVKLRDDVLARFSDYQGQAVLVREERKTVVDLRSVHPDQLAEAVLLVDAPVLCFLCRSADGRTRLQPLDRSAAWPQLLANTVYWDEPDRLAPHLRLLEDILRVASVYELAIGPDPADIAAAVAG